MKRQSVADLMKSMVAIRPTESRRVHTVRGRPPCSGVCLFRTLVLGVGSPGQGTLKVDAGNEHYTGVLGEGPALSPKPQTLSPKPHAKDMFGFWRVPVFVEAEEAALREHALGSSALTGRMPSLDSVWIGGLEVLAFGGCNV